MSNRLINRKIPSGYVGVFRQCLKDAASLVGLLPNGGFGGRSSSLTLSDARCRDFFAAVKIERFHHIYLMSRVGALSILPATLFGSITQESMHIRLVMFPGGSLGCVIHPFYIIAQPES